MSIVKSFTVGAGDMFYIKHNSDNFTIIDCCLDDDSREDIVTQLIEESSGKGIRRFISTHPDEDHIQQIEYLDGKLPITNFYCVENSATKDDETPSFKHYCGLRDSSKAFYVSKGCRRKWMNTTDEARGSSGINILWPDTNNADYKRELNNAKNGVSFNNISLIAKYSIVDGASFQWHGDLETAFMESITKHIALSHISILFAPHHGRDSGKVPNSWLNKLRPKIIVLGEAPSRHLYYYTGYNILKQNEAGDIIFDCVDKKVHIYVSNPNYKVNFLQDEKQAKYGHYLGTLNV